jgi:hypothetical protein
MERAHYEAAGETLGKPRTMEAAPTFGLACPPPGTVISLPIAKAEDVAGPAGGPSGARTRHCPCH